MIADNVALHMGGSPSSAATPADQLHSEGELKA